MREINEIEAVDIDIMQIPVNLRGTVQAIEDKPHRNYIRFLMTKRMSPGKIRNTLKQWGFSAPHDNNLRIYYFAVIHPVIEMAGAAKTYQTYSSRLASSTNAEHSFAKDELEFRIEFHESEQGDVDAFAKAMVMLSVDHLWSTELYRYYKTVDLMPKDNTGESLMNTSFLNKPYQNVLKHPKRYIIDQMIVAGAPTRRIVAHFREQLNERIDSRDISIYKKTFFDIRMSDIEKRIRSLEVEQNALRKVIMEIESKESAGDEISAEEYNLLRISSERLESLEDSVFQLNSTHSDLAFSSRKLVDRDYADMFADMTSVMYGKFKHLSQFSDRDIVPVLSQAIKSADIAFNRFDAIKKDMDEKNAIGTDAAGEIIRLSLESLEDVKKAEIEYANEKLEEEGINRIESGNVKIADIGGIEEVAGAILDKEVTGEKVNLGTTAEEIINQQKEDGVTIEDILNRD